MKTYHFSCGDSTQGTVGLCARVSSETAEDALLKLRRTLEAVIGSCGEIPIQIGESDIEYINVYISPDNIKVADIDEETGIELSGAQIS